jgi:hypothetical protein
MVYIKDPDWYLKNQSTPDKIWTNGIFFALGLYHFYKGNTLLGILFILLGAGSTAFHLSTSNETLLLDRIAMVFVFSYFFNLFYTKIPILGFSAIGLLTVLYWYNTEELLYYFLFQLLGLLLFMFYFPMNPYYKLATAAAYIGITYIQMLQQGKYHSLKHIGLGLLTLVFKS